MKIAGIIVEYNPLHNGHVYHIENTRKTTKCDFLVAVMSGNFVQRGEPAIIDKWSRTEAALKAGIDLVIELPFIYSISSAEKFAFGAIQTLDALKKIDYVCFGSELGCIVPLNDIAELLINEPIEFQNLIKTYLNYGLPFAKSREKAITDYFKKNKIKIEVEKIIKNSNNILGIEYIKALKKISSNIQPITIKRIKNNYNDIEITSSISSATSIRVNFENKELIKKVMPNYTFNILNREIEYGKCPVELNSFFEILLYKIRTSSLEYLRTIHDVTEGLEYKLKRAAEDFTTLNDFINSVMSKRYTKTRIQRILLYIMFDITKEIYTSETQNIKYIRILGANKKGRELIKELKEIVELPIITNVSKKEKELLKFDIMASNIYVLGYKNKERKKAMQDLKTSPILVE
ncbi:hypothetical protein ABG79_01134 [Caloramator mitchellensis]|uniref:tRNA(Met) cytidine acetate ligase n=1 Tax=Caloramator mitchellensis TaxID=908809 RepID=A0A0R3JTT2_CALMK|nr:nucleotidyltransferase [Caloramator mitchellensis]KRQ86944.1 hypothetical protein ABG79_01134 [Caloramator mitchellensis]